MATSKPVNLMRPEARLSSLFTSISKQMLAGVPVGWLAGDRERCAQAVRISFPFCVTRRRYSRPACSITTSPQSPNNVRLSRRTGGFAVSRDLVVGGAGLGSALFIVTNDNDSHFVCQGPYF